MSKSNTAVIILAAGNGTRMKSDTPKISHKVAGLELIRHVYERAKSLNPEKIITVLGKGMDNVARLINESNVVIQDPPQGTGDAVRVAHEKLTDFDGIIVVLYGDVPLISQETLESMITAVDSKQGAEKPAAVVLGFRTHNPASYGRIVASPDGKIESIVEFRDADEEQKEINLCNSGIYAFDGARLGKLLQKLESKNAQNEYYLTDCIAHALAQGWHCELIETAEAEVHGVNTRQDLAVLEHLKQNELRRMFLLNGVTMTDPDTVYFSYDTSLGRDVLIEPNVYFGPGVKVNEHVHIKAFSHIEETHIENGATVGPFARLRPGTTIGANAHVGNFVEVKNSTLESGVKAGHLTYIGDAKIGAEANIGAGTITCNYDGFDKNTTVVEQGAFIGSNTALVAPVKINKGAYVAAGSVISKDVSEGSLGITRAEQREVKNWAARHNNKNKQKPRKKAS